MDEHIVLGSKLSLIRSSRASVVPYLCKNINGKDVLYFLFGIDKVSLEITDFGGGVKKEEFSLQAALREFKEESDIIFGDLYNNPNDFINEIAIHSNDMSVLFIPLSNDWYVKAVPEFKNRKNDNMKSKKRSHCEMERIFWMDETSLLKLLNNSQNCSTHSLYSQNNNSLSSSLPSSNNYSSNNTLNSSLNSSLNIRYFSSSNGYYSNNNLQSTKNNRMWSRLHRFYKKYITNDFLEILRIKYRIENYFFSKTKK